MLRRVVGNDPLNEDDGGICFGAFSKALEDEWWHRGCTPQQGELSKNDVKYWLRASCERERFEMYEEERLAIR